MRGKWEARLPVLREGFRELGADIVTLQETILTEDTDQAGQMLGPLLLLDHGLAEWAHPLPVSAEINRRPEKNALASGVRRASCLTNNRRGLGSDYGFRAHQSR